MFGLFKLVACLWSPVLRKLEGLLDLLPGHLLAWIKVDNGTLSLLPVKSTVKHLKCNPFTLDPVVNCLKVKPVTLLKVDK